MKPRITASLSLDLDNQWSYMKTRGDERWKTLPSYLHYVVPRFLQILAERDQKITVFIVGQDAAIREHHEVLRSIADAGHEVGNHSFKHEPWLHLYTPAEIEKEIATAEEAIEEATGVRTQGFRGPGFSVSDAVLRTLAARGYNYDCSTFPTFLGPLARAYYFFTAKLSKEQQDVRNQLFGTLRDGLRPIKPYSWMIGERPLVEIPVTTMPGLRIPIHLSYILYLATYSRAVALAYCRTALAMCAATGVGPSMLLHPLDFVGKGEAEPLAFFPAMGMAVEEKLFIASKVIDMLRSRFDVVPVGEHARIAANSPNLSKVELQWQTN